MDLFSATAAKIQPNIEKFIFYFNEAANIAADIRNEFFNVAQIELDKTNQSVTTIVEDLAKREGARSKNMIQMTKSTVENADNNFGKLAKKADAEHDPRQKETPKHLTAHNVSHSKKNVSGESKRNITHKRNAHWKQ